MARKKGSDEGSVYFRTDRNKWIGQYYDTDPVTLKRKHIEKSFSTEEEARAFLRCAMYQKENSIYIEKHGITLKDLMTSILDKKLETNIISEAQYERVQRTQKNVFKSELVNKKIEDITPEEIQRFVNTFRDYSNSSIKKIFEQFNQAFKYAIDRGYLFRNPMAQVIRPKSIKQQKLVRAMTLEEENRFVNYLQNKTIKECPYKNEFLIQLFMGLRIGECLALAHKDIDLMNRKMYIHKTLTRSVNGVTSMSNSPKTQAGNRYLPIPDSLFPYIVEQMRYSNLQENNEDKLLFKPKKNKYTTPENVNRALTKILDELNIEHMASHSLRHTYATRAIEAGVTPVVLQRLMGHTDVSITLNTYTDVFDKYKENELSKVNNYYIEQNLLQPPTTNDVKLDNNTLIIESKANVIEDNTIDIDKCR